MISHGSLFLTLPTRALTGQHNMPSDVGRVGGEQGFQARLVGRFLAEPFGPRLRLQHHGHPVVQFGAQFVGLRGDDREAANTFTGPAPSLMQVRPGGLIAA